MRWFHQYARNLPWRKTGDPYKILLSEVMLQQTQVSTVKNYYRRFLRRFPTLKSLARAPLDDVLKVWEGLGYYARARNLHRLAQMVFWEHGGKIPQEVEALRRLPGIGRYTAGAISSIAFDRREPVLDGNVKRVLCRIFAVRQSPKEPEGEARLWKIAESLVPEKEPGIFNQALMELGATLCAPRSPRCSSCPLQSFCRASKLGVQESLPFFPKKVRTPFYEVAAGVVRKNGKILIARRLENGLLGGLWEFPGGKKEAGESLKETLRREVAEELGVRISVGGELGSVKHAYTHFRIRLTLFDCRYQSGRPRALGCSNFRWVRPKEISQYAFPAANKKLFDTIG